MCTSMAAPPAAAPAPPPLALSFAFSAWRLATLLSTADFSRVTPDSLTFKQNWNWSSVINFNDGENKTTRRAKMINLKSCVKMQKKRTGDNTTSGVVLIQGVGELLARSFELHLELKRFVHRRIPLILEKVKETGDRASRSGARGYRLVLFQIYEFLFGHFSTGNRAFIRIL